MAFLKKIKNFVLKLTHRKRSAFSSSSSTSSVRTEETSDASFFLDQSTSDSTKYQEDDFSIGSNFSAFSCESRLYDDDSERKQKMQQKKHLCPKYSYARFAMNISDDCSMEELQIELEKNEKIEHLLKVIFEIHCNNPHPPKKKKKEKKKK